MCKQCEEKEQRIDKTGKKLRAHLVEADDKIIGKYRKFLLVGINSKTEEVHMCLSELSTMDYAMITDYVNKEMKKQALEYVTEALNRRM